MSPDQGSKDKQPSVKDLAELATQAKPSASKDKPTIFMSKSGHKTPTLRIKKDEKDADFVRRMTSLGYKLSDPKSWHKSPGTSYVHGGVAENCPMCKKLAASPSASKPSPVVTSTSKDTAPTGSAPSAEESEVSSDQPPSEAPPTKKTKPAPAKLTSKE